MSTTTSATWTCLTRREIEKSPSSDDMTWEEEQKLRRSYVRFLQKAGALLELPVLTICTSCVFFQRFFTQCSFSAYDPYLISQACVMLAAKAEENSRRVRDIINTTHALQNPGKPPLQVTQEYWAMKEEVIKFEQLLLRVFAFDLNVQHPHHFVLHFVRDLEGSEELASTAWCILNDSLCSTLCLQYRPEPVACAAIYLAGELIGKQLSHGDWFEAYETSRVELEDLCIQMTEMYETFFDEHNGPVAPASNRKGSHDMGSTPPPRP